MSDDNTVSFVFGLEVNWSLLQVREEATREEVQRRKEQARADLEALNAKRRTEKAKESKTSLESDSKASYHESAPVKAGAKKGTKKDASKKSSAHADVAPITKKSAKNRRADLEDGRGNVVNLVNDKDESVSSDSDSDSGSSSDDSSAAVGDDDVGTEMDVEAPPMINKRAKSAESSASIKQTVAANTKRRLDQILDDSSNDESSIHLKSDKVSKLTSTVKKSKTFLDSDSDDDNQVELLSGTYSKSLQAKSVFSQKTLEDSSDDDFGLRRDAITEKPSVNSKSVDAKKRKKTALSDSDSDDTDQSVTKPLAKAKSSQAKSVAVNKGVVDLIDSPNDRTDKENVNRQHTGAATNTTVTVQKKKNIAVLIDLDDD